MTSNDHYRLAPRLGLAALVCLGAATAVPFAQANAQDPKGNNGTVKVAPYGDIDSIPNNTPHVGCTFQLEWYGFDAGVTSTVLFEEQPPTTDVGMSVSGDTTVVLDDDPGAGAGDEGLDASQVYTLSFTGAPHPQQGFHVRLTINTPESKGADVKHKVFWVEGCTPPTAPPSTPPTTPIGILANSCTASGLEFSATLYSWPPIRAVPAGTITLELCSAFSTALTGRPLALSLAGST